MTASGMTRLRFSPSRPRDHSAAQGRAHTAPGRRRDPFVATAARFLIAPAVGSPDIVLAKAPARSAPRL